MVNLSKSKYCALWQCPKMLWLRKYKPELAEVDSHTLSIMETGNAVGDLAMGLFGDFTEVTVYTDGEIDLPSMMRRTQEEIAKDTPVICEASFDWNGLYCAVDILRREGDGRAIYEVKSSTSDEKSVYIADVAYQKFVLEHCGVKVTGTYLVVLDRDYIFDGTLDLQKMFKVTDVGLAVAFEQDNVAINTRIAEEVLKSPDEPGDTCLYTAISPTRARSGNTVPAMCRHRQCLISTVCRSRKRSPTTSKEWPALTSCCTVPTSRGTSSCGRSNTRWRTRGRTSTSPPFVISCGRCATRCIFWTSRRYSPLCRSM